MFVAIVTPQLRTVALHPEGVDRNRLSPRISRRSRVALHPEGVDRNAVVRALIAQSSRSPSTRRAWIEMAHHMVGNQVDESPSTRRAWIEIVSLEHQRLDDPVVALHPEGVDRNHSSFSSVFSLSSRPPPGGRG